VYDPIARWTWSPEGWSRRWGTLDFAGGSAVHITSGSSVLAHCVYHLHMLPKIESALSRIFGKPSTPVHPIAHNTPPTPATQLRSESSGHTNMILGTLLLWIGWFGFNGGSALGSNPRAVSACISTHLAACSGAVSLCFYRAFSERFFPGENASPPPGTHMNGNGNGPTSSEARNENPDTFIFSISDFCSGAVIGLVCITPAAGYVPHQISPVFGIVGAVVCWHANPLSEKLDDYQQVFVVHGIGGFVGMLLTGIFARGEVAVLDGVTSALSARGGWDGHWIQLA
jgi:Amt family ammonium transporter